MTKQPSLMTRIIIGKSIGFTVGLVGLLALPLVYPEASWLLRWGFLLWYTTFGAIIGVFGVFTWHPIAQLPLPWWLRSSLVGAWLNFVLTFFAYDQIRSIFQHGLGAQSIWTSPFFVMVIAGLVVGLVIGFTATYFGGEGKEAVEERLA